MAKALKSRAYTATTSSASPSWGTVPSGKEWTIIGLMATNKSISEVNIDVIVEKDAGNDGGTVYVSYQSPVPAGDRLDISGDNTKFVIEENDVIKFLASSNSAIDILFSYLETDR